MANMPPIEPGVREIDPDAEAARLTDLRQQQPSPWPPACDEVFPVQLPGCRETFMHIRVTTRDGVPLPADLGARLANVVRALWPQDDPR